jgi:hypothetical protein
MIDDLRSGPILEESFKPRSQENRQSTMHDTKSFDS